MARTKPRPYGQDKCKLCGAPIYAGVGNPDWEFITYPARTYTLGKGIKISYKSRTEFFHTRCFKRLTPRYKKEHPEEFTTE